MFDYFPEATTFRISRIYKIPANDRTHAIKKLNLAIEQGYDDKYLTAQNVVEYRMDKKKEKHPWLKELVRQVFLKRK